jgi:hypothetical protein
MSNNHRGDNAAPNASDVARDRRFESISLQQRPLQTCFLTREDSEKRTEIVDGGARKSYGHRKPLEEWQVLLKDHHVGICPPRYGCTRGPTMARTQPASLARAMGGGAHFADRVRASAKVTLAPNSARAAAGTKAELKLPVASTMQPVGTPCGSRRARQAGPRVRIRLLPAASQMRT